MFSSFFLSVFVFVVLGIVDKQCHSCWRFYVSTNRRIMTESCKAVVVYKDRQMSHTNILSHHSKGVQHQSARQAEGHTFTSDYSKDDNESSITTGSSSTYGDDVPSTHQHHTGSPSQRGEAESSSLGNSVFYDDSDAVDSSVTLADPALTAKAIERTKQKIEAMTEQIQLEQVRNSDVQYSDGYFSHCWKRSFVIPSMVIWLIG